jgi:3-oxoacyl-(acyl-carrier-protein) synthase III
VTDLSQHFAAVMGVGAYRPRRSVSNQEICGRIDSSDEWIRTRSGIVSRGWADDDETLELMASSAAAEALQAAGFEGASLGMVIVATCSDGQPLWPLATRVAARLGTDAPALQLNATCAGFCYGLGLARDLVRGGTAELVLVVGAERMSDLLDPSDRGTSFLFADGAGAFVVGRSEHEGVGPVVWGSDGERGEALTLSPDWTQFRNDPGLGAPSISMQGRRVFKWVVEQMPPVAEAACKAAGVSLADIDVLVPHQANHRMTEAIVRALDLPDSVVVADDIIQAGNTSAASIPLATHRLLAEGRARGGDLALLIGYGGGLGYAAQVVTMPLRPHRT